MPAEEQMLKSVKPTCRSPRSGEQAIKPHLARTVHLQIAKAQARPLPYQAMAFEVLHMDSASLAGEPQGYLVLACSQGI